MLMAWTSGSTLGSQVRVLITWSCSGVAPREKNSTFSFTATSSRISFPMATSWAVGFQMLVARLRVQSSSMYSRWSQGRSVFSSMTLSSSRVVAL